MDSLARARHALPLYALHGATTETYVFLPDWIPHAMRPWLSNIRLVKHYPKGVEDGYS